MEGTCDVAAAVCFSTCGIGGTILGLRLARHVPDSLLKLGFAGVLCCLIAPIAGWSALRASPDEAPVKSSEAHCSTATRDAGSEFKVIDKVISDVQRAANNPSLTLRHCFVGACVGVLTGAVACGETPVMIAYLTASGYTQKEAIGTALLGCTATTTVCLATHVAHGTAILPLLPITILCMGAGGWLGAKLSSHTISDEQLKLGFASFVLGLGFWTGKAALTTASPRLISILKQSATK
jgi:uncharacterized membrane protein YfcA